MQICPFFGNLCNLSYTKRNPQWTSIGNLPPITVPCVSLTMIMWSSLKTWVKKVKNFSKWLILNNSYLMTYGTGIWILTDQKKCLGNQKKNKLLKKKIKVFFCYWIINWFFSFSAKRLQPNTLDNFLTMTFTSFMEFIKMTLIYSTTDSTLETFPYH